MGKKICPAARKILPFVIDTPISIYPCISPAACFPMLLYQRPNILLTPNRNHLFFVLSSPPSISPIMSALCQQAFNHQSPMFTTSVSYIKRPSSNATTAVSLYSLFGVKSILTNFLCAYVYSCYGTSYYYMVHAFLLLWALLYYEYSRYVMMQVSCDAWVYLPIVV